MTRPSYASSTPSCPRLPRRPTRGVGARCSPGWSESWERRRCVADMAIDVTTQIVIDPPADEVAAYAGDPTNAPRWYENIDSVDWQTSPPVRLGSKMDFVARF